MSRFLITAALLGVIVFAVGCSTGTVNTSGNTDTATTESSTDKTIEETFTLTSTAFKDMAALPAKYAQVGITGGENISVPLMWDEAPSGTKSFALVCIDRNANDRVHWAVINIPSSTTSFPENGTTVAIPETGAMELKNTSGNARYDGPRPPAGSGIHNYEFSVYALSTATVSMPAQPTAVEFETAVKPLTIKMARITGLFENK